jgi:hypothetical protein
MIDDEMRQMVVDFLNSPDRAEVVERIAQLAHCAALVRVLVEDDFTMNSDMVEKLRAADALLLA